MTKFYLHEILVQFLCKKISASVPYFITLSQFIGPLLAISCIFESMSTQLQHMLEEVHKLSRAEQLALLSSIAKMLSEEEAGTAADSRNLEEAKVAKTDFDEPAILSFAGIMDEEEAKVWESAVEESRKIDQDEW